MVRLRKANFIVFALLSSLYILAYHTHYSHKQAPIPQPPDTAYKRITSSRYLLSAEYSHTIVVSSFRTGSSLLAATLGLDTNVFHVWEPLHNTDPYLTALSATPGTGEQLLKEYVSNVTTKVLGCQFPDMDLKLFQHIHNDKPYTGRGRPTMTTCKEGHAKRDSLCVKEECEKVPFHLTKLVRVSLRPVYQLMEEYDNVKIIWLYRDPRAVWNRRINYNWCTTPESLCGKLDVMCRQLNENTMLSEQLKRDHPSQFMAIRFEDILKEPKEVLGRAVRFTGHNEAAILSDPALAQSFKGGGGERHDWKSELDPGERERVEQECRYGMTQLGYL